MSAPRPSRGFFSLKIFQLRPLAGARARTHTHTHSKKKKKRIQPQERSLPSRSEKSIYLPRQKLVPTRRNTAKQQLQVSSIWESGTQREASGLEDWTAATTKKKLVEFEPGARGKPRRRCSYAGSVPVRGEGKYDTLVGTVGIFLIAFSSVYLIYFSMPTPLCPPCGVVLLHGGNDTWVSSEAPRNSIRFAAHWQFRIEIPIETHH